MDKVKTSCCALSQLSGLNNNTSITSIKTKIRELKRKAKLTLDDNREAWHQYGIGETTVFVVTTPKENILEDNLLKAGFQLMFDFKRRIVTMQHLDDNHEGDSLKFWIYKLIK